VFDRARAMKRTTNPNPFEKRGALAYIFPPQPVVTHRRAIRWEDVPGLYATLIALGDHPTALAARFMLALALSRSGSEQCTPGGPSPQSIK
jgi:hypothetical protein